MYGLLGWLWWKSPAACHCLRTEACKRPLSPFPEQCTSHLCHPLCIILPATKKKLCSFESGLWDTCIFLDVVSNLFCSSYSWWFFIYLFILYVCVCVCVYRCGLWGRIFHIILMSYLFCWLLTFIWCWNWQRSSFGYILRTFVITMINICHVIVLTTKK